MRARFRPGQLVRFRRGRVAHIVGRTPADGAPRTVCGQQIGLEDLAGDPRDPDCRACTDAPPSRRPAYRPHLPGRSTR